MNFRYQQRNQTLPITYILIGINVIIYFICRLGILPWEFVIKTFALIPYYVYKNLYLWQFITHFFIHDISSFGHVFFNMFALLMFGIPLERMWGPRRFFIFYMLSGILTGMVSSLIYGYIYLKTGVLAPMIGASGAIYALTVGFAFTFPNAMVMLFFFFPMKAKYLPLFFLAGDLIAEFSGRGGNIAHWAHLSGLLVGFIIFAIMFKLIKINIVITKKDKGNFGKTNNFSHKIKMSPQELAFFINMCIYKLKNNIRFSDQEISTLKKINELDKRDVISLCNPSDFNYEGEKCSTCKELLHCILRDVLRRQG
ncbi:MAG TPA: rhomboid family intramembrane serine protease [Exilispira sp.]|nr:rhomboid family intramembrane serine protease [Exilispira sp.]